MTSDEIKSENPLDAYLIFKGIDLHGAGDNRTTNVCPIHEHKPGHLCVSVNVKTGLWHCNDDDCGGDVIRWMALAQGKTDADILKSFSNKANPANVKASPVVPDIQPPSGEPSVIYDYLNQTGRLVYQVCRYIPKTFRQRHKGTDGKWVWNMQGVQRVLYNLPAVLNPKNRWIWVVEGEKDVNNLTKVGMCATTNVGGAEKWSDGYSDCLKGKEVVICGDNDEAGQKHVKKVLESLAEKANSIHQIKIPDPHKDVSEFIASFDTPEKAGLELAVLVENAPVLSGGIELPISSAVELEAEYNEHQRLAKTRVLTFGSWLPSLACHCRPIVPGEMVSILAATGVGKTALLQNLAMHAAPLPTLLFEMELPGSLTFERFCAMATGNSCQNVEDEYSANRKIDWQSTGNLNHIWTCTSSTLTPEKIENLINKAELKMGVHPALVLIDYIQLISGRGSKRYEVISDAAEELKRIAKTTKTIIVIASQVKRKDADADQDITLHDAKESGSIENSCGLVLGVWRPEPDELVMRILKNTKGRSMKKGDGIHCDFNGATMTITERPKDLSSNQRNPTNDD
jgi:5S rRNA maturation endonuclease (ribonuclease M5)